MKAKFASSSVRAVNAFILVGMFQFVACLQRKAGSTTETVPSKSSFDHPWLKDGIKPRIDDKNVKSTSGTTQQLILAYANATREFQNVYGPEANPSWIVSVRSNRFISRKTWDKIKNTVGYNPIAATDQYELKHDGKCRTEGMNVWAAYERASIYVNRVLDSALSGKEIPWSNEYTSLSHIKAELNAAGKSDQRGSSEFDLDVIQSVHAANGQGATQNSNTCGKLAQLKTCDGHSYSPFFSPWYRPSVCTTTDWTTGAEQEWAVMMSDEMRNLGQTILPVPALAVIEKHKPSELKGASCLAGGRDSPEIDAWRKDKANDWPMLKNRYPEFTSPYMNNEGRSEKVKKLALLSGRGEVAAYMLMAPVQQTYKELANMTLKPGLIRQTPECRGCALAKLNNEWLWDPVRRSEQNLGFCPRTCWKGGGERPSTESVRAYFQTDPNEPKYLSFANRLNRHFDEKRSGSAFSVDPIKLATQLQQNYVAIHPFIDGDGRTSRYYMEIVLNSVGLPFPVLNDFWADTTHFEKDYEQQIRDGISRHINVIKACTAFASCQRKESNDFKIENICQASASQTCSSHLSFSYGISGQLRDTISPCDCSIHWNKDPETAKFKECK